LKWLLKFFRLSIGNEVRLKNAYHQSRICCERGEGIITEIHVTYDDASRSGSGSEASQRKVAGTLHWVSIKHAVEAEVRLYDRLFIDEAPDSHKEKTFGIQNSNSGNCEGFVEPSLASSLAGINFSSNVWVISIQIKIACQEN
jgi:glutaminyl-tRNA synthetase